MPDNEPTKIDSSLSQYGYALGAAAVAIGVLMLLHPSANAHSLDEFKTELPSIAPQLAIVHGIVIASEWLAVVGLIGLCDVLGCRRLAVRGALVSFVVGIALIATNALINGFILPGLLNSGGREHTFSTDELRPLVSLWKQSNIVLTQFCVMACSTGMLLWSLTMLSRGAGARVPSLIGVCCGALPLGALILGRFPLTDHDFGLFVAGQCLWYGAVAVQLARGRI